MAEASEVDSEESDPGFYKYAQRVENEKRQLAYDKCIRKRAQKIAHMDFLRTRRQKNPFFYVGVEIVSLCTKQRICTIEQVGSDCTIAYVKDRFENIYPEYYPSRQSFHIDAKSKSLKDTDNLQDFFHLLDRYKVLTLYFEDLGPQMNSSTLFYCEYLGPLIMYLLFFIRPFLVYDSEYTFNHSTLPVVWLAAMCHTFHYAKKLFEIKYVHISPHGTDPVMKLVLISGYSWAFAAWMSFFVNHPLYTPALYGNAQICLGLAIFIVCELGNLFINVELKRIRTTGTRLIPKPSVNPLTWMFYLVSCPDHTYAVGSWIGFVIMTQTLVGLLFASMVCIKMSHWALEEHRNYRKKFPDYPLSRKAIFPCVL